MILNMLSKNVIASDRTSFMTSHLLFKIATIIFCIQSGVGLDANQQYNIRYIREVNSPAENYPPDADTGQNTERYEVIGIAGGSTDLFCNLMPAITGDDLLLVLWYKIGTSSPVYTFDVRGGHISSAVHYSDKTLFDEPTRAVMRVKPIPSALVISNLIPGDTGLYKCRADFKRSPTRHSLLNLTVIVPPHPPTVLDVHGEQVVDTVGPVVIGSKLTLYCRSHGGRPSPELSWWIGNKRVAHEMRVINGVTLTEVTVRDITKQDHGILVTCRAVNNNVTEPAQTNITLKVAYPPQIVRIESQKTFISGEEYTLICHAFNSSGLTTFRWFIGKTELPGHTDTPGQAPEAWTSKLRLKPTYKDHEAYISCVARNIEYPDSEIQDGYIISVQYVPELRIRLGHSLTPNMIQAGEDVYFTCGVNSNPDDYTLAWRHNGKFILENTKEGILFGNHSLVLQAVQRNGGGLYTCTASNRIGDGESNALSLDVKYAPECLEGKRTIIADIGTHIDLPCKSLGNPSPKSFAWKFRPDDSKKFKQLNETDEVLSKEVEAYGQFFCSPDNGYTLDLKPCVFTIKPSDSVGLLSNCKVENLTHHSVHVYCTVNADKEERENLSMKFWALLWKNEKMLAKQHQIGLPDFFFTGLESEQEYSITLFSKSTKGRGAEVLLNLTTSKQPEKQLASKILESLDDTQDDGDSLIDTSTLVAVVIGACLTLAITAVFLIYAIKKSKETARKYMTVQDKIQSSHTSARASLTDSIDLRESTRSINSRDSYSRVMSPDTTSVAVLPYSEASTTTSYIGDGTNSTSYLHLIPPDGTPNLSTFSDANKSPPIKGHKHRSSTSSTLEAKVILHCHQQADHQQDQRCHQLSDHQQDQRCNQQLTQQDQRCHQQLAQQDQRCQQLSAQDQNFHHQTHVSETSNRNQECNQQKPGVHKLPGILSPTASITGILSGGVVSVGAENQSFPSCAQSNSSTMYIHQDEVLNYGSLNRARVSSSSGVTSAESTFKPKEFSTLTLPHNTGRRIKFEDEATFNSPPKSFI